MLHMSRLLAFAALAAAQTQLLTVSDDRGNATSDIFYGALYEDIYQSGDGGFYAELIRNRAFQGSRQNGQASSVKTTDYWTPVGTNVKIAVDESQPQLSSTLTGHLRIDIPNDATGLVGMSNAGYYGFNVDQSKRYAASLYVRGAYSGTSKAQFRDTLSNNVLHSVSADVRSQAGGWTQVSFPVFQPSSSVSTPNNTFEFLFDSAPLRGQSLYLNLFSVFKQTYRDRGNGMREDLALAFEAIGTRNIRLPGGNNMEGPSFGEEWKWNETIGDLTTRNGHLGTWGDEQTDGFGLLEQLQWCLDMNQTVILGIFAGLHIGGDIVPEDQLGPFVTSAMNELEFLMGDASTTWGARRAALGYPRPFDIQHIEIGNEDYLWGGKDSYYNYRFKAFYDPIHAKYPDINLISSIIPSPVQTPGTWLDIHIYESQQAFANEYAAFDQTDRNYPVIVGEYACIFKDGNTYPEIGAQTMGMSLSEGILLLGAERNSDVIKTVTHGAMLKHYDREPSTVAVMKQTANSILKTNSYYLQKLLATYFGEETLEVTTQYGEGIGPLYWSAQRTTRGSKYLKILNYYGPGSIVEVVFQGSHKATAEVITFSSPGCESINNLPGLGGETSTVTSGTLTEQDGKFRVEFGSECEIKVIVV